MTQPVAQPAAESRRTQSRLRSRMAIPLLLAAVTVAVYCPILRHPFVALDDGSTVYENQRLLHFSSEDLYSFWTSSQSGLYAPLTYTLFAGIAMLARRPSFQGGVNDPPFYAWPFHAVSLLLHVLIVLVVWQLLRRLIGRRWPAAAGALLFALHPVQVETVAWITEINGLLCTFLTLSAVLLYVRSISGRFDGNPSAGSGPPSERHRWTWFVLATEVFVLALLAKPLGVMTPALAAVAFWLMRRQQVPSLVSNRVPWELAFWLVLAIPVALIARAAQPVPERWLVVPLWLRPLVAADALAFYVYKLLLPLTLVPDYGRSPHLIRTIGWGFYTWIVPVLLGSLIAWLWRRRRNDMVVAGAIWFVLALLPVLGFTPFAFQRMSTVADRYLYLPMFGVSLCAAGVLAQLTEGGKPPMHRRFSRRGAAVLTTIVLVALGARTVLQIRWWRDTPTLFQHTRDEIGRDPGARPA